MSQRSYDDKNKLYLIPTPIGNIEDITYRAINILNEVDLVFSEDTRETIKLLNYYGIKKPLISAHKFNEEQAVIKMLEALNQNKNIALVSDRGTPLISDPGNLCVKRILEGGFSVVSLPGATALIPAITASGLSCDRFLFYGFLENRQSKRKEELKNLKSTKYTIIFYEAPHRILETLGDILTILGNREISISREISKKYEEIYRGPIENVIKEINDPKGEFVIVVEGSKEEYKYQDISISVHLELYKKQGYSEKEAMKMVAKDRNISKSDVYQKVKISDNK